jgi:hypothetical protein
MMAQLFYPEPDAIPHSSSGEIAQTRVRLCIGGCGDTPPKDRVSYPSIRS